MSPLHIETWSGSETIATELVDVLPLDALVDELELTKHRVMLKIDVQGYELNVLRGAKSALSLMTAAFVELLFAPLYQGQSRYSDVIDALDAAGLKFAGLYDEGIAPSTARPVLFANALFIRINK